MSYQEEFLTVDIILNADAPTHAVDGFALSVVKMERQIRKLFTYLVYQSPTFGPNIVDELKSGLGARTYSRRTASNRVRNSKYCRGFNSYVGRALM